MKDVSKTFKVLNRRQGLCGMMKDLFSRDYKMVKAVENVSLDIYEGEIVAFLGPNGAGKSTTIKMLTGVIEASSGELLVNGYVPSMERERYTREIGVVFGQRSQLWWSLPLIESFKILKEIYCLGDKEFEENLECYNSLLNIKELYSKPVREMSLGQRTLSDILAAFLYNPKIVFLDEPTIGLDLVTKDKIHKLIKYLNKEKKTTIILTTHDIADVDALCEKIVIIDKGKLIYNDSINELKSKFKGYRNISLKIDYGLKNRNEEHCIQMIKKCINKLYSGEGVVEITYKDGWFNLLLNEDKISIMSVLEVIQENMEVSDVKIQDIFTEEIIRKIYEESYYEKV